MTQEAMVPKKPRAYCAIDMLKAWEVGSPAFK